VTVDIALNLIWLVLGAVALLATRYAPRRTTRRRLSTVRFVSVIVVLAALFPYISALDDSLQLAQVRGKVQKTRDLESISHVGAHSSDLVWLFESLNDAETGNRTAIPPGFIEYTVTATAGYCEIHRPAVPSNGRAPPAA
jgi:hypothetical protein